MKTTRLLAAAGTLAVMFSAAPAEAKTCKAYKNQAAAQRAHDTRDADGDGIYCESLACPCSKKKAKKKPRALAATAPARTSGQRFCGYLKMPGGKGEAHANHATCKDALKILRIQVARGGRKHFGWTCKPGGTNGAVFTTCRKGSRYVVLYQPASVYGE